MSKDTFHIRDLEPGDAIALQALLQRCYGDSYFDGLYYDTSALRAAIEQQRLRSSIAVNGAGDIVAHLGMRHPEGSLTSDSSMAIVDPSYRARGLLVDTGAHLCQTCLDMELCGIYGQAVTVHTYTQQSNLNGGAGVSGIYLNYIPAGQRFLESGVDQSLSPTPAVVMLTPLSSFPERRCYAPPQYVEQITLALQSCHLQREILCDDVTLSGVSVIDIQHKAKQQVCYFWIEHAGVDVSEQVESQLSTLSSYPINAYYIHLPLDQGNLHELVEQLRKLGFFYAGILPEYCQRDWLLLQRIVGPEPSWSEVRLAGEQARQLLAFIQSDCDVHRLR